MRHFQGLVHFGCSALSEGKRTDIAAEVSGLINFDAEIWLHFANDFGGVVEGQVSFLFQGDDDVSMLS